MEASGPPVTATIAVAVTPLQVTVMNGRPRRGARREQGARLWPIEPPPRGTAQVGADVMVFPLLSLVTAVNCWGPANRKRHRGRRDSYRRCGAEPEESLKTRSMFALPALPRSAENYWKKRQAFRWKRAMSIFGPTVSVPMARLEPTRRFKAQRILSPLRLPFRHIGDIARSVTIFCIRHQSESSA